jgi:hypothetical protein
MRTNRYIRVAATLIMVLALSFMPATAALANADEAITDSTEQTVEATDGTRQQEATPTAATEPEPAPKTEPVELTPDGQMTLIDDISGEQSNDKQFLTIITKGGNYFYIVIDRAGDTENVHFLNLVDESDLLALIEEAPVATTTTPVTTEPEPVTPAPTEPEPTTEQKPDNNLSLVLGLTVAAALAGGGALFYLKVLKPRKEKGSRVSELDDFDFDDDEPDILPYADEDDSADDIAEPNEQGEPAEQTEPNGYEDYEAKEDRQ